MIRLKCDVSPWWSDSSTLNSPKALGASLVQTELRPKLYMIRFKCAWNRLWSDSSALKSTYNQTQLRSAVSLRSKHSWFRLSCAWSRLWSDSVMLEVLFDQTQVRSKPFMIKFGRAWQSACARSPSKIRIKYARQSLCARSLTDPDSVELKAVYEETQLQSNSFMIRLKCVVSRLWSDSSTRNSLKALEASLVQTELRPIWSDSSALEAVYDQIHVLLTIFMRSNPPKTRHKYARQSLCARSLTVPDSVALKAVYEETQLRSNYFMIRLKCVVSRLWSDSSTLNSLKALEASLVQTELRPIWSDSSALDSLYALAVRSNPLKIRLKISLRFKHSWSRHSCARSWFWSNASALDSSHTLVVRSIPPLIKLKCAGQPLSAPTIPGPDSTALEAVYDPINVLFTIFMRS